MMTPRRHTSCQNVLRLVPHHSVRGEYPHILGLCVWQLRVFVIGLSITYSNFLKYPHELRLFMIHDSRFTNALIHALLFHARDCLSVAYYEKKRRKGQHSDFVAPVVAYLYNCLQIPPNVQVIKTLVVFN